MNRRQAIFGSIAAAFTGPTLVQQVELMELRKLMKEFVDAFNKHTHFVPGGVGPTEPMMVFNGKTEKWEPDVELRRKLAGGDFGFPGDGKY
jgi:hypothetical protein